MLCIIQSVTYLYYCLENQSVVIAPNRAAAPERTLLAASVAFLVGFIFGDTF